MHFYEVVDCLYGRAVIFLKAVVVYSHQVPFMQPSELVDFKLILKVVEAVKSEIVADIETAAGLVEVKFALGVEEGERRQGRHTMRR